ncbi:hypothetical protein E1202_04610 [Saccharopolyspora karakumensis]|uniref:Uncharacterized protein n=1 Tax=Saccharopolyspora karakumensis TaxID=2530386 RepID=A0A4R5C2D6_9PSEU|nr:hypothetical protein [Saccharopolyspora karakumensis]TDD92010.1 hypothetical protein E1202_04610 [Saccharopolyspora karakumensis]
MRKLRNALLGMAVAAIVPISGLGTHIATIALEIREVLVQAAHAAPEQDTTDFLAFGTRIRSEPVTTASVRGIGNPGDTATIHRRVIGEPIVCGDGRTVSEWLDVTDERSQISGFVSGCFI